MLLLVFGCSTLADDASSSFPPAVLVPVWLSDEDIESSIDTVMLIDRVCILYFQAVKTYAHYVLEVFNGNTIYKQKYIGKIETVLWLT